MHFLCDAIDLKQSVEGTLKVQGKFLTTVLDEIHFIINLYSFPLPLVPQAKPFFLKVSLLPSSQAEQLPNPPKISLKDTFFYISINSLGLYLSPECLLNFLSNFYIPPFVGKIFKFSKFPENAQNSQNSPLKTRPQVLVITP